MEKEYTISPALRPPRSLRTAEFNTADSPETVIFVRLTLSGRSQKFLLKLVCVKLMAKDIWLWMKSSDLLNVNFLQDVRGTRKSYL